MAGTTMLHRFATAFARHSHESGKCFITGEGGNPATLFFVSTCKAKTLDSRFRGNDEQGNSKDWIPAFAGMTIQ